MSSIKIPDSSSKFSTLQLELLRLFAHNPTDEELVDIKKIIGQYYLNKLSKMADRKATNESWTIEDVDSILNDTNQ
ncbi:MAG: hypothetical protein ACOYOA_04110 [Saprospiraceae bacterium]